MDNSPVAGVMEKIEKLRSRHEVLAASIASYETKVAKQAAQLARMNHPRDETAPPEEEEIYAEEEEVLQGPGEDSFSANDFREEEAAMRELEEKRRGLEDRVSGMEKDLGGLMR